MSILFLFYFTNAYAQPAKLGLIQSAVIVQDANSTATGNTTTNGDLSSSSISGQAVGDSGKSDYEKLMDQRRLQRLNKLWTLYWNRERDNLSSADAKRVSALIAKVSYPSLSAESSSSVDVTAAMRQSISSLGHQLEIEQATAVSSNDSDTAHLAAQNIEYLHGVVEHNLTESTYWLSDTPEAIAYNNKVNSTKVATAGMH